MEPQSTHRDGLVGENRNRACSVSLLAYRGSPPSRAPVRHRAKLCEWTGAWRIFYRGFGSDHLRHARTQDPGDGWKTDKEAATRKFYFFLGLVAHTCRKGRTPDA